MNYHVARYLGWTLERLGFMANYEGYLLAVTMKERYDGNNDDSMAVR